MFYFGNAFHNFDFGGVRVKHQRANLAGEAVVVLDVASDFDFFAIRRVCAGHPAASNRNPPAFGCFEPIPLIPIAHPRQQTWAASLSSPLSVFPTPIYAAVFVLHRKVGWNSPCPSVLLADRARWLPLPGHPPPN